MSKNAMDMNFLVGKSYTYLKRLFGDRVNIPGDFILANQSEQYGQTFEEDNNFLSVKSKAEQVGSSQIISNGKILADIEQYNMNHTFINQSPLGIVPPIGIENSVKIKETKSSSTGQSNQPSIVSPNIPNIIANDKEKENTINNSKETEKTLIKESVLDEELPKPVLNAQEPKVEVKKNITTVGPQNPALTPAILTNTLKALNKTGRTLTGGEIIYP
jgi:hypothetical protein